MQVGAGGGVVSEEALEDQIQKIGKRLRDGESAINEASEKAVEARSQWQKIDSEHKQAQRELTQAKKSAEDDAKNSPELKAARERAESLREELADIRKKEIEKLTKVNSEYRAAVKAHEEAVKAQKANSGPNVSADVRRDLVKKAAEADKRVKSIEDVAMADNPEAKQLSPKIKEANTELAAVSKKKNDAIESDPKLTSAKVAFNRTRDELKKAKAELDQATSEANRIRSAVQALNTQRESLQSQLTQIQQIRTRGKGTQIGTQGTQPTKSNLPKSK